MACGRFESTPYIRSRVFESLLAFQTQVNDPDTYIFGYGLLVNQNMKERKKECLFILFTLYNGRSLYLGFLLLFCQIESTEKFFSFVINCMEASKSLFAFFSAKRQQKLL
jgi:hypothetical protein